MTKFVEHIADLAIQVCAPTFEGLFKLGLEAMNGILKKDACQRFTHYDHTSRVVIRSTDRTSLLIDFLSEVLALSYIQKTLFCNVYFNELTETKLDAQLWGIWFDHFDEEIKGVTYHEAQVKCSEQNIWSTNIIFDI